MSRAFDQFGARHGLLNDDLRDLNSLVEREIDVTPNYPLSEIGKDGDFIPAIVDGYVAKFKLTPEGREQIVAFYQAGDLPDLCHLARSQTDAQTFSVGKSRLALIRRKRLTGIAFNRKAIAAALWREMFLQQSISNEWLLNLGQRNADQRVAHFFLERLSRHTSRSARSIRVPLRQRQIAAVVGVSEVHVCRILKELRTKGYMQFSGGVLNVLNEASLARFCGFSNSYIVDPLTRK